MDEHSEYFFFLYFFDLATVSLKEYYRYVPKDAKKVYDNEEEKSIGCAKGEEKSKG